MLQHFIVFPQLQLALAIVQHKRDSKVLQPQPSLIPWFLLPKEGTTMGMLSLMIICHARELEGSQIRGPYRKATAIGSPAQDPNLLGRGVQHASRGR